MFIDFNRYIQCLVDKKLTPNQYIICHLIYHRDLNNMKKYVDSVGKFNKKDIEYLIDKGYLLSTNPNNVGDFISLVATKLFSDTIIIDEEEAFEEVLDIYPDFFYINRSKVASKACSNILEVEKYYYKLIKGDRFKHESIIEKSKKVIRMMEEGKLNWHKIDKFILGQMWKLADKEKLEGNNTDDLMTFL